MLFLLPLPVLLPYEITLFSNKKYEQIERYLVLLPYEITLFSNSLEAIEILNSVLLPYEITLFSNYAPYQYFFDLFYYLMKLHYSQTFGGRANGKS